MFRRGLNNRNKSFYDPVSINEIELIQSRYGTLIDTYNMNSSFLDAFNSRLSSAKAGKRNAEQFLEEETTEYQRIEKMIITKYQDVIEKQEALKRVIEGNTTADKVLNRYKDQIEKYEAMEIYQGADPEVCKLYGAIRFFDINYWDDMETYLRRAFPQPGQLDRMSIELRFWTFVSSNEEKIPDALARYRRVLEDEFSAKTERRESAREAIKLLAFFLHDLQSVIERASQQCKPENKIKEAQKYIQNVIEDFRLQALRRNQP